MADEVREPDVEPEQELKNESNMLEESGKGSGPAKGGTPSDGMGIKAIALVIAAIIIAAAVLGYIYMSFSKEGEEDLTELSILLVGKNGSEENLTLKEIMELSSVQGKSSYQNQFGNWKEEGNYEGVLISTLVERVGGMEPGDTVKISASDYSQEYCYLNVYPDDDWHSIQGDFIIAYEFNGTVTPNWEDGPKSAFLPEDQEHSNQDCNWTSAIDQGYNLNPSAGARWVKQVNKIEVIDGSDDWYVNLTGKTDKKLYRTEFDMFKNWFGVDDVDNKGDTWSGVPMHSLLGLVDGGDARGTNGPNATLASQEFLVTAEALDGYSKDLITTWLYGSDQIFLADEKNGDPLAADYAPLRISGDVPKGSFKVSQLMNIALDFTEIPKWAITLNGTEENTRMSIAELQVYFKTYTATGGFLKVTGTIVGPDEYTGVLVEDLLDEVGSEGNYSLLVVPIDYYNTTFTKSQVEGNVTIYDSEGNVIGIGSVSMLLAFQKNGDYMSGGEIPRIVYVSEEGAITDGHYWVKEVNQVIVEPEPVMEWSINISGLTDYEMDRATYESIANCDWHRTSWTDTYDNIWEGVPLWIIVSTVDGNDTHSGHASGTFAFNDTLAEAGYNVTVRAGDDYNKTFPSDIVARNDTIILAYMKNGERLEGSEWPLRLVGEGLSGSQKVSNVVSIELVDLP